MLKKLLFSCLLLAGCTAFSQSNSLSSASQTPVLLDNYLDFDGVDDYVDVAGSENILANKNTISLSCKIYPKNPNPGFPVFNGIAGYRNESNFDFYLIQLSANTIEARFRNSAGVQYTILYNGLVLNQWNHLFFVYDGAKINLYSGNTLTNTLSASGSAPATNSMTFKIGLVKFQSYNWYHTGYIDEVSLWNKALNASDIAAIMANGSEEIANPNFENNLLLYYKFNQGIPYGENSTVTTANDENFAYDGQLMNFALTGNSSNWGGIPLSTTSFENQLYRAYPNPASTSLTIEGKTAITRISIYDVTGRLMQSQTANFSNRAEVELNALSAGIYFAEINRQTRLRFVKE